MHLETEVHWQPIAFLKLQAGVAFGTAVIGNVGALEETHISVMGEAVAFASRLMEFAEDNKILVNPGVHETTMAQWNFNKMESIPMRGSKEILGVFELIDKKRRKFKPF